MFIYPGIDLISVVMFRVSVKAWILGIAELISTLFVRVVNASDCRLTFCIYNAFCEGG